MNPPVEILNTHRKGMRVNSKGLLCYRRAGRIMPVDGKITSCYTLTRQQNRC